MRRHPQKGLAGFISVLTGRKWPVRIALNSFYTAAEAVLTPLTISALPAVLDANDGAGDKASTKQNACNDSTMETHGAIAAVATDELCMAKVRKLIIAHAPFPQILRRDIELGVVSGAINLSCVSPEVEDDVIARQSMLS
jgi:hypothetical protein